MKVSQLTPEQRAAICNGVGPKFAQILFKPFWRAWSSWEPNIEFYEIACQHDLDYWIGGGFCEKWAADDQFIAGCMRISVKHTAWRKWVLVLLAQSYGLAVKSLLGWFAWHFGQQRTRHDLEQIK